MFQASFHCLYDLVYKMFFPFPCFQIRVFLCAVITVKIIDQGEGNYMAVGSEFLLVHGLQIFPGFPLQIFLQIKAEVCASDIVSHRLLPPFQVHLCQIFVTFRCGTDIIKDCDTSFVIRSKIPDQAAATAYHVQPHQVRVVFIFAECGENISYILSGNCCNAVQIRCGNISCSEPKNLFYGRFLDFYSKPVQNGILCGNHALVYPEFFCPAAALLSFFVVDI